MLSSEEKVTTSIPQSFEAQTQDLMNCSTRAIADQQLHFVVSYSGRLDEKRMERAVRLAMEAEPVLGCRFVSNAQPPVWKRRTDLESLELCKVIETSELLPALFEFAATPLDLEKDPEVQARIFRAGTDTLCLKIDHAVADARGAKEILYLVVDIYRELTANGDFLPVPNLKGTRSQQQVFEQVGKSRLERALQVRTAAIPQWGCPSTPGGDISRREYILRRFVGRTFQGIKDFARQHKATLNDLLITAL